jgi:hypothetical protein
MSALQPYLSPVVQTLTTAFAVLVGSLGVCSMVLTRAYREGFGLPLIGKSDFVTTTAATPPGLADRGPKRRIWCRGGGVPVPGQYAGDGDAVLVWANHVWSGWVCDVALWDEERGLEPYLWEFVCGDVGRVFGLVVVNKEEISTGVQGWKLREHRAIFEFGPCLTITVGKRIPAHGITV